MVRKIKGSNKITIGRSAETAPSVTPFFEVVRNNLLYLILGLVAILLLSGGGVLWNYFDKKNEEKASTLFYQAYQTFKDSKEKEASLEEPMKLFQTIIEDYPRTSASELSYFYLGNCQFVMKKFDVAIDAYSKFLEKVSSQPQLALLAYDSLGYCYEEKKDYKKAIEYFQKTITPPPGLGESGYFNAGRCFEALGDSEGSLNLYKKFLLEFPDSSKKSFIQEKIKEIELEKGPASDVAKKSHG
ncbi:MAG: tetratricopeptide repeat protein [Thermodesulfobacteriota bacterium]|nr:MAG: tetratricopeptide repeat protein [Thermodesulfobacteriota bacterium]